MDISSFQNKNISVKECELNIPNDVIKLFISKATKDALTICDARDKNFRKIVYKIYRGYILGYICGGGNSK